NQMMDRSIIYMRVALEVLQLGTQGSDIGHPFWHFDNSVLDQVNSSIAEHGGITVLESFTAN
ncbi:MAG: hypothetical protein KDI10_02550, partial [Halioglobus sp.]|nr:hypothetical protein [Halioglobus sp.]